MWILLEVIAVIVNLDTQAAAARQVPLATSSCKVLDLNEKACPLPMPFD